MSLTSKAPRPHLWRNPDFRGLWAGQTASQLGEQTSLVLLPLLAVLTLDVTREPSAPEPGEPQRMWRQIRSGLRFVAGHGSLRTICLASAAFQFFLAATMTGYLLFLPRELGLSGAAIGLVLAAVGPGALAGSLLAGQLPRRLGYGPVLVAAAAIGDGAMLGVPALHDDSVATVVALIVLNLVFGACGLLAEQWTIRTALLATAAGMLLSPALMAVSPLRRLGRTL